MPTRPRSHQLEDLSRNRLREIFTQHGWTVEDLQKDYGEDLLIRIFDEGKATPLSFFVQAKSTDHIERYRDADGKHIRYPVSLEHAKHWGRFWEPVILTVWDAQADVTYWQCVQTALEKKDHSKSITSLLNKNVKIHLPTDNTLDDIGVRRIRAKTKHRFSRFEAEQEGAKHLIQVLEEELKVKISYDAQEGILTLERAGSLKFVPFGKTAARLEKMSRMTGLSSQGVLESSFDVLKQIADAFHEGNHIVLKDKDGTLLNQWKTFGELQSHVNRQMEISEESEPDDVP